MELARRCKALDRLHYVSTCYVSGRYVGIFGEEDLDKGQTFNNYYEETKYLAEVEVQARMRAGYSRSQGERYEARLRKLKRKRSKVCR